MQTFVQKDRNVHVRACFRLLLAVTDYTVARVKFSQMLSSIFQAAERGERVCEFRSCVYNYGWDSLLFQFQQTYHVQPIL